MIRAVVFDVGECLVDETREYGTWADWLQVPRHTFAAVFGAVIAQGRDYRETFQEFRPGFDLDEEREKRAAAGHPEAFDETDLYDDVRPALAPRPDLARHRPHHGPRVDRTRTDGRRSRGRAAIRIARTPPTTRP